MRETTQLLSGSNPRRWDHPAGHAFVMDAIRTEGLTKRYGSTLALDDLDLTVGEGEVYGFLGPNGSGKTTTIRLLLGLHRPTPGTASVFGLDAWRDPVAVHRRLAYVAGEPFLWPQLTGEETLVFLGRMHGSVRRGLPANARRALPARAGEEGPRALEGQPAEDPARRGLRDPSRPARARRADERARPADGGRLPRNRPGGEAARPDRLSLVAHPERGRGAL